MRLAFANSPARRSSRMRELETISFPILTGGMTCPSNPWRRQNSKTSPVPPAAPAPKRKSYPTINPRAPQSFTRDKNSSGVMLASSWLKSKTRQPSNPKPLKTADRSSTVVKSKGVPCRKKPAGCSRKVTTRLNQPFSCAFSFSILSKSWWPRWTPSKLPMVTIRSPRACAPNSRRMFAMENQDFTFSPSLPLSVCCCPRENPDRLEKFFPVPSGKLQDCRQPVTGDTGNWLPAAICISYFAGGNGHPMLVPGSGFSVQFQPWQMRQRLQGRDDLFRHCPLLDRGGNLRH